MTPPPITRLCGKKAIITASTDGIGFAIAQRLAQEGAIVILSSRQEKNVDMAVCKLTSHGLKASGVVCHVANAEHRKKLFEEAKKIEGLDILVSNAGINPSMAQVLDCEESTWDKIFEVNVKASYLLAKEALPFLRASCSGRIIFVSSIGGFQPLESLGAYSVSKTALIGLTKAASAQLAEENITVNCVAPGIVDTKFSKNLIENEDNRNKILAQIPMNRIATPLDVIGAVAFLASDEASYITGETIIIAGGMPSRL